MEVGVINNTDKNFFTSNILYMICSYILLMFGIIITLAFMPGDVFDTEYASITAAGEIAAIGLAPIVFICTPAGVPFRGRLRLVRGGIRLLLIVPVAIAGYIFVTGVTAAWLGMLMNFNLNTDLITGIPKPETFDMYLLSLLVVAVVPALFEEFFYRGMMLPAFERKLNNPWTAVLLSGALFALMHGQILALPGHFALGMLLGYIVVATNSLWAGIILHFLQNAMSMTMLYLQDSMLSFLPGFNATVQDSPGTQFFSALTEQAVGPTLMLAGCLYMAFGGVALYGLLRAVNSVFRVKEGNSGLLTPAATQPLLDPSVSSTGRFLPWLPIIITLPLILLNYLGGIVLMLPIFS